MKKMFAVLMVVAMMLALGATAFAAGRGLTLEQAKQRALDYAGVKASEAIFTKAQRDFDDGREVYEIEFYANNTEYEMNVLVYTGQVTDFSMERLHGMNQPGNSFGYHVYDDDDLFDDDWLDFDD